MANITAADVNKLRKQTGLGMMDCKNALVEADGDFDKAIEILRKKGQKVAEKRGDREASEGYVIAKSADSAQKGVIMVLNCETDFVAKNDDFVKFATGLADLALTNEAADAEALKNLSMEDGRSVQEHITEQIGKIGEKLEISEYGWIEADTVIAYNHPGNNIGSLVGLNKGGDRIKEVGREVAMQVAAMAPVAVNEDGVPENIREKELEIGREQAKQEGKPEQIIDKIAEGKLKKFLKENTLLEQQFIKDNKKSVGQYLKEIDPDLTVTEFKRISIAQ